MSSESSPASTKAPETPVKDANAEEIKRQIESVIEYSDPCTFEAREPKQDFIPRQNATSHPAPWISATAVLVSAVGFFYFSSDGLSISKVVMGIAVVGIVSYGCSRCGFPKVSTSVCYTHTDAPSSLPRWSTQTRQKRSNRKKNSWF
ncbi:uncharacterized protein BDV14DRAFT_150142 [Aspergillus stella-maris]|uniref:uncharacterized protein n=1 Tax=Aspergillus stella-maris TaxID=1810926 RepID=UPI003CCD81F1